MSTPKVTVRRCAFRFVSDELHTTVVRGYGFRAECSGCAWRGEPGTYAEARKDRRLHRLAHDTVSV